MPTDEFYLRYYVGHKGKFGHEFMEFEFSSSGKLRYANNSNYKNDSIIKKEVNVSKAVLDEVKRMIADSEVTKEDDNQWPEPDRVGRQELEIKMNGAFLPRIFCLSNAFAKVKLISARVSSFRKRETSVVGEHISFTSAKIGSLLDVQDSKDPDSVQRQYRYSRFFVFARLEYLGLDFPVSSIFGHDREWF